MAVVAADASRTAAVDVADDTVAAVARTSVHAAVS